MVFTIALTTLLFIFIIQLSLPYFVKRTIVFGVSIPEPFLKDEQLHLFKRRYVIISLIASIIFLILFVFWVVFKDPSDEQLIVFSTIIQFIFIFISFALYFYFYIKTKKYKKVKGWTEKLKEVAVTDLSLRATDDMPPWYIYLLPICVVIGLIIYTFFQYDLLPNQIPTHWGPNGEPDAFTEKNYFSAIQLLVVLLILQLTFLGIQIGMKNSGIRLSATNIKASKKRQLASRKYTAWFLYYSTILLTVLFVFLHLETIHPNLFPSHLSMILIIGFIFGNLLGTIVLLVKVGSSDKNSDVLESDAIMDKDEDKYWKGGLFYFNRNDPSIFVEKRFGVGWTINFANPKAYFILFVPIILILVISFL